MQERRKARHQALHILYQSEITAETVGSILGTRSWSEEDGDPAPFCRELLAGVEAHRATIDATIEGISENWVLSRMPIVDRNILRLAAYEIVFAEDIPASVSINEAVEMAKVYGGEDSSKFVNGILGRLADECGREEEGT
ncbi:MAG TPA: transcription antitermination factor NusB [Coriobacteriia bacterium]|jgi:N utilization substance protein B